MGAPSDVCVALLAGGHESRTSLKAVAVPCTLGYDSSKVSYKNNLSRYVPPCDILLRLRQWEPECARSPSAGRQLRLRRARFDSRGYRVDGRLRPRVEGAG